MSKELTTKTDKSIKGLLQGEEFKRQVALALPRHLAPDRFVRVALTAITRTPKLADCDPHSFFQALLTLSQLGLEPDGRRAHLIPFENRKRNVTECQLIVDYKGLVELAMRSGDVSNIHADKVCENDEFEYDRGEIKCHKINFRQARGDAYAYYALCRFKDGGEKADVMTREEVSAIRSRSRAKDSGPWVTDFDEMAKKTVFRRLSKWLTLSPEYRDALEADADTLEDRRIVEAKQVFDALPTRKPDFSLPDPQEDEIPMKPAAKESPKPSAPAKPRDVPPQASPQEASGPDTSGLTDQEKIAIELTDRDFAENWFVAGLRGLIPDKVAKAAKVCDDLSDEVAAQVLADGIDEIVARIPEVVK